MKQTPRRYPLLEFVLHTLVGTGIFLAIALPAVLINWLVHALTGSVDSFVLRTLTFVEYFILAADAALFAIHIVRHLVVTVRRMKWHDE